MRFRSILVPIALGLLFILLALFGGPENRWDVALVHAFARERAEHIGSTSAAVALTQFGSVYGTMGAGALACLWLWFHGEKGRTALLVAGVVGERIVMDGMKLIIGRPRPDGRQTMLICDLKTGALHEHHDLEAGFYALVSTLRHGVAPFRSVIYSLAAGDWSDPQMDANRLIDVAHRCVAAVNATIDIMLEARTPELSPGRHCAWCPAKDTCPAATF